MALPLIQGCFLSILLAVAVKATPPPGHIPTPDNDLHPPKYEYGYIVTDNQGSQGHVESRDGIYALGRYHVTLPDGSAQKVTYFADDWGYHPLVSYGSSTEHGASRTEFALGDQAVQALKNSGSPVAPFITSPQPTQQVISTVTPTQNPFFVSPVPSKPSYLVSSPQQVQVSNAGASGHQYQGPEPSTTTPATVVTVSTTTAPPTIQTVQTTYGVQEETASTAGLQAGVTVTPAPSIFLQSNYQPQALIQNQQQQQQAYQIQQQETILKHIQQQQEAHHLQEEIKQAQIAAENQAHQQQKIQHDFQQQQIQQTLNKLEQDANQQVQDEKQRVIAQSGQQAFQQAHQQQIAANIQNGIQLNQNQLQEDIKNRIQQNIQLQINEETRQQIEQQEIQNQIRVNAQQEIQQQKFQQQVVVTETPQPVSFTVQQQYSQSVAPSQQFVSAKAEQLVSVQPTQQYTVQQQSQSTLGSLLLQEVPNVHNNVQIVTPTPYLKQFETYPVLSGNGITSNNTEDDTRFTVEGQNVQITSYLADTNKVLSYGDRIQAKDRQAEQRIIDEIEKHAKLRIFQDLQKNSLNLKPIIVTGSPSVTTETSVASGSTSAGLLNIASYNVGHNNAPPSGGASPPSLPLINHGYLQSNSLSQTVAEKSDLPQTIIGATGAGFIYSPRQYISVQQLAPLQAGLAILTAPEKPAPPVNEESKEVTVVDIQKGLSFDFPQNEVAQYQALGYERRLVDSRAQQAVSEKDPNLQALKTEDLAARQELELKQVQESIQELQKQIVNQIDAQHEEEQRQQENVANERQKHLDNLQRVEELIKVTPSGPPTFGPAPITDNGLYQGPQYLPPLPYHYEGSATSTSYQNVAVTSTGQDIQTSVQETKTEDLAPPPAPPSIVEIEKPVIIEKPVAVETTKIVEIEKPVLIKETVPVETTKVVEVQKTVPVLQPYPVTLTRVVTLDRPVAVPTPYGVPQPIPFPFAVPHAIEVPYPQLVPYPEIVPIAFKQYHPVFIHPKNYPQKELKPSKRMPEQVFREPRPQLFQHSHAYHTIPLHMKTTPNKSSYYRHYFKSYPSSSGRNRNSLKNLRIEYGGFKPPLVPSTEYSDEPKPSPYGPSVKEE